MNFDFFSVPRIVFGRGRVAELGSIARGFGDSALIVHNGGEVGGGGAIDKAADSLKAAGVRLSFYRQRGEPTTTDVDGALTAARGDQCQVIIGVGGGSAIDCAKAVAGLLTNGGAALDYMEVIGQGRKITKPAAPWIAVPTTAGTGAEVTRNAVIGSKEHKYKASLRSEHLLAKVALVDAELGVGTPPAVTAASGMDALCQCIEAYTSKGASPLSDSVAIEGIHCIVLTLRDAFRTGADVDAREHMALGALCSGIALTNAGLGAVHGFAAPIGANFAVPHGVVCARLLAPVITANVAALHDADPKHPVLDRYGMITGAAHWALLKQKPTRQRLGNTVHPLITFITGLVSEFAIPPLSQFGLREDDIGDMVSLAKKSSSMKFNPVVLADDVLANILRSAL
jgi:alcohol dehydrogenase class IV